MSALETKQAPSERGLPWIGILPALLRDALGELTRITLKHAGEIPVVHIGPIAVRLLTHPDHVQHILQDNWRNYGRNSGIWKPLRALVGEGLFLGDADVWQKRRRLMQPLFLTKHISGLAGVIRDVAARRAGRWEHIAASGTPVDMVQEMTELTMAMFFEAMFGVRAGDVSMQRAGQALQRSQRILGLHVLLSGFPDWVPRPMAATLRKDLDLIDDFILGLVRERRSAPSSEAKDLLTWLVRARDEQTGEALDDTALRDEMVTLFVGGTDTTSITLSWLWYVFYRYPEVAAKVRAEVEEVLGGREPSFEDLAKLSYTKRVIQETMRCYTLVLQIPRVAARDDIIDGYRIRAGETILVSPHALHMSPAFWDRPVQFDPDRFLPERSEGRPRFAYLPFGGGPRQCIGNLLAMMEMQIVLAVVLPRFGARLVPGHPPVRIRSQGNNKPHPGLRMQLIPIPRSV